MALTDAQKTSFLYKQGVAQVAETNTAIDYYSEQYSSRLFVYPTDVWSQKDSIPSTAPVLADGATSGVVQYFSARSMTYIAGTSGRGYYLSNLVDSIPFNFGTGYSPAVTTSTGTSIAFGVGEWVINPAAGTLYFYGTLPTGVNSSGSAPPKVSFYKYVGTKSLAVPLQSSGTLVGAGYTQLNFGSGLNVSIASSVATVTATGGGGGSSLTVKEVESRFGSTNVSVSNVTELRFNNAAGFNVEDETGGVAFIDLGSTFNPWYVNGQDVLKANGEEPIEFIAGPGIAITTKATASVGIGTTFSKAIIITATGGGGGGGGSSEWVTTSAGIHTLSNVGIGTTNPTAALEVRGDLNGTAFDSYELELLGVGTTTNFNIQPDGIENTFIPTFNYDRVTVTNPHKLLVTVNGIIQSAFINNTDYVHQSNFLGSNSGYTIDTDNNIKFTESVPSGSEIMARVLPVSTTATRIKYYPFKPTDILLGY